ncbi:putative N-acetyltransferase YhbS [Kribbella aluminosa]|uniref:N-acetyltransferase YhbS n=1 Tax=Kribbella aluminosa TaxID=416017 RepID=A0ABS4UG48_9ACTN|nr:GNAT family N-acetyltransferase [Kribbella aluminosa]MBP2350531.1 putative N-acetyltransferase YhbS [Kribbella aluminosa]
MDGVTIRRAVAGDAVPMVWRAAFGDVPWQVPLYVQDAGRFERTFVAVSGRTVLATVYYLIRPIRGLDGAPVPVGCVANVASLPHARGRGLVRWLLAEAITDMERHDVAWSLLFTGTPGVYERSGWQTLTRHYRAGRIAQPGQTMTGVDVWDASLQEWPVLAQLYDTFNASRPLTTVRTASDWQRRVRIWYADSQILLAGPRDEPNGYVVLRWDAGEAEVQEIGVKSVAAAAALLDAVARRALARGVDQCRLRLPDDPLLTRPTRDLLTTPLSDVTDATAMIRPVTRPADWFGPDAVHWPADYF